jgi:hypothetical protein
MYEWDERSLGRDEGRSYVRKLLHRDITAYAVKCHV